MTMTIELTPDEEARLREKAKRDGRNPEEFAVALVRAGIGVEGAPPTLAETLAGRVGLFRSETSSNASADTGAAFTEIIAEKHRQGHL